VMRVKRAHGADHYARFSERRFFRRRDERSLSLQSSSTPVHAVVLILTREGILWAPWEPSRSARLQVFGAAPRRAPLGCVVDGGRWVEGCGGRGRRGMGVNS
jgi:hypothetical protein